MAKHAGLGKGLAALIPGEDLQPGGQGVTEVDPAIILPNPRQPRTIFDPQELQELADSIRENGIIQPLIVSPAGIPGEYFLVAGERRLKASKLAGLASVPVIIRDVDQLQQLELALVENVQRQDLSPLETAEAYRQLVDEFSLSHEAVAKKVGKSRVAVTNCLRLLRLPEKVKALLQQNKLTEGHARVILALPAEDSQVAAAEIVVARELNVRQTEVLVQHMSGQKPVQKPKAATSPQVKEIEDKLREALGTKVNVNYSPKGGSVVIHYYSDEELESIIHVITRS